LFEKIVYGTRLSVQNSSFIATFITPAGKILKNASVFKIILTSVLVLCFLATPCHAIDVEFTWDASVGADYYVVYWGTSPGPPYPNESGQISDTNFSRNNLPDDTYYFAVTAFSAEGESAHSREICVLGSSDLDSGYDRGWAVTDGELKGFSVMYNSITDPNVTPTLGSSSEIPPIPNVDGVGLPLNLEVQPTQLPGWTFSTPVKIFIPCPTYSDVSGLNIYYWDGVNWLLANDADDANTVQPDAESWMVEGSRDNTEPYAIGVELYHFSGVQAGTTSTSTSSSSGGGGGGGCFIGTVSIQ
jgi:hypothetical protein